MSGLSTNPSMSFRPSGMLREASHEQSEGRERNLPFVPPLSRFGCGALSPLHGPGDSSLPFDCAQGRSE